MGRPLRILVAQNIVENRRNGMSRMVGFLHDRVAHDGHMVEYFTAERVPSRLHGALSWFAFPWLLWRHAVAAAAAGRPYDAINVHERSGAVLALGKRAAGNPYLILTGHGQEERAWAVTLEEARLGRMTIPLRTRVWYPLTMLNQIRFGLRRADHVFCLNEDDRAFVRRRYSLAADRVTRVFPAADAIYTDAFARRDYGTTGRLLFFGTWLPRKGTTDLVAAFTRLAARHPDLRLTVIGAGCDAARVLVSFPEPLRGRVTVVPPDTAAVYAERMLEATVYLLPSVFEGTPLTLMESMATGLPAVGTATCGMKEVIKDGSNGFLVPLRDADALAAATERLLLDRDLRERLGRQAHADVVANFTWDRVAAPVRAVYERLADYRRRGRRS
jgi:glycosyltransferase involved in cell wall biosynthesis